MTNKEKEKIDFFISECQKVADAYGISLLTYFNITLNRGIVDMNKKVKFDRIYDFGDQDRLYSIWLHNGTTTEVEGGKMKGIRQTNELEKVLQTRDEIIQSREIIKQQKERIALIKANCQRIVEIETLLECNDDFESRTCENCVLGDYIYKDNEQYQQGKGCLLQYYAAGTARWHNLKSCSEFEPKDAQCK